MEALGGTPASTEPADFVVTTWNTGLHRASTAEVVDALRSERADVVSLQELPPESFAAIETQLADRYPYCEYRGENEHSLAVLSRVPLEDVEWVVPESGNPWMRCSAQMDGQRVNLVALHLSATVALLSRYAPASANLEVICAGAGPTVLFGDFNMTHRTGEYQRIAERGFVDSFEVAGAGFGFTFPVFLKYRGVPVPPMVRIDQVWSRGLRAVSHEVLPPQGSDHRAVRVGFRL